MGNKGAKPEVVNENISVNTNTNTAPSEAKVLTEAEVFGLAVAAVIVCYIIGKKAQQYFKNVVRTYAINEV